jgi:hypothetical protein
MMFATEPVIGRLPAKTPLPNSIGISDPYRHRARRVVEEFQKSFMRELEAAESCLSVATFLLAATFTDSLARLTGDE